MIFPAVFCLLIGLVVRDFAVFLYQTSPPAHLLRLAERKDYCAFLESAVTWSPGEVFCDLPSQELCAADPFYSSTQWCVWSAHCFIINVLQQKGLFGIQTKTATVSVLMEHSGEIQSIMRNSEDFFPFFGDPPDGSTLQENVLEKQSCKGYFQCCLQLSFSKWTAPCCLVGSHYLTVHH